MKETYENWQVGGRIRDDLGRPCRTTCFGGPPFEFHNEATKRAASMNAVRALATAPDPQSQTFRFGSWQLVPASRADFKEERPSKGERPDATTLRRFAR